MPHAGYDVIVTRAGVTPVACRVCGSAMDVQRNAVGPTGFASAIGKINTVHDRWTCPHSDEEWHALALRIVLVNADEPSPTVAALRQLDLEDLIREHGISRGQ